MENRALKQEAYIRMAEENRNLIYKVCRSFCRAEEDRRDLEQEILIRLWNGFDRFDGRVKVSTWVYRVALNTAISFYRTERRKGSRVSVDSMVFSLPDTSENNVVLNQNIERLYHFIEELKDLDRALILLFLDDVKYSEISTIIGITETNVATKINRIKEKLRKKFNQLNRE